MSHRIRLVRADDRDVTIAAPAAETVLDAAEEAGESLPFGCRTGACGSCTGQLLEGSVEYRQRPRALKDRHREAGYVLSCVAEPRTDCRIRVGPDLVRELVDNPFR